MSRSIVLTLIALLPIVCSCSSNDQKTMDEPVQTTPNRPLQNQQPITSDSANFKAAFERFFTAIKTSDTATINQFIHPTSGLWIIEQPGAMPKMSYVTNISHFKREFQGRHFFTIKEEVKTCNLQQEPWPTFDCADMNYDAGQSGYSKDGCFVAGPGKFVKSGYWNYADLPAHQIKQIEATLPHVQQSVLHTATSFEFHFGFIEGTWRLLFVKLIYPCSA